MTRSLYWLASYPKSGNTWMRSFITQVGKKREGPLLINSLEINGIASSRAFLDNASGVSTADLHRDEIENLRPDIYAWHSEQSVENTYFKIHDACTRVGTGDWITNPKATAGTLYLVRNPLDVAVSYANHNSSSIDAAIVEMNNPDHCLNTHSTNRSQNQVEQRLLTWSQHVESWVDNPEITIQTIRYEDMKTTPHQTFTQAATFLGLKTDAARVTRAIDETAFDKLRTQEESDGFLEGPAKIEWFFRKGIMGDWQQSLTTQQIDKVIENHHSVMQRFGYLDAAGTPRVM